MYTIIGFENIEYVNKASKKVQGLKIHCTYNGKNIIEGKCVESFFLSGASDELMINYDVQLGDVIMPLYNRYGNVQSVQIISKGE